MEKYVVNGQEVAFDTFDLDVMLQYEEAVNHVAAEMGKLRERKDLDSAGMLQESFGLIVDFFELLLGAEAKERIFGGARNIKVALDSYRGFTEDVTAALKSMGGAG